MFICIFLRICILYVSEVANDWYVGSEICSMMKRLVTTVQCSLYEIQKLEFEWWLGKLFRCHYYRVHHNIEGLAHDCSNSIAYTLELLHSCAKSSTCYFVAHSSHTGRPAIRFSSQQAAHTSTSIASYECVQQWSYVFLALTHPNEEHALPSI